MPAYTPVYRCSLVRERSVATEPRLESSEKAKAVATNLLSDSPNEQFVALLLDTKHRVIGVAPITAGTLDASLVHPREVFRPAILANAAAIIGAHNHPSGDLAPSKEDWRVHERLTDIGKTIGITYLDSIIVDGVGGSVSLKQEE